MFFFRGKIAVLVGFVCVGLLKVVVILIEDLFFFSGAEPVSISMQWNGFLKMLVQICGPKCRTTNIVS